MTFFLVYKTLQQKVMHSIFSKNIRSLSTLFQWNARYLLYTVCKTKLFIFVNWFYLTLTNFNPVRRVGKFLYIFCLHTFSIIWLINAFLSILHLLQFVPTKPSWHTLGQAPLIWSHDSLFIHFCYKDRLNSFQNILTGTLCKEWYGVSQIL